MNKVESIIYNLVRKNPALKQFVRNCYQSVFDLLPRGNEFFINKPEYKKGYFFGFHDVSPFSLDETKLLGNKLAFDLRMPKKNEPITVGYFDFKEGKIGEFHEIGKSYSWNYHKGCRLQWIDECRVIYNSAKDGKLCSIITNINDHTSTEIPFPIDAVHGNLATTFSYERLERCMPGYGYPYNDDGKLEQPAPKDTGLFLLNLKSGERTLLLSLNEIAIKVTGTIEDEYLHFVTHTEFSKDGKYLSFLYRRIPRTGDYMKRRSVIGIYDLEQRKLHILPSQESGSHYVWNNKNQLIASCILNGKSCHVLFDSNNLNFVKAIAPERLNSDGHQSFVTDDSFITDTYPDRRRLARLYAVDITSGDVKLISKIYSPKKFQTKDFKCHIACDLHPRVSPSGRYVCFDSPQTGQRGLYVMKIK
ncbi:MAG: hypothetical protein K2G49_02525 [Muribaculum sp.]|nr:hypothetical protein [Muribaculum sp.]